MFDFVGVAFREKIDPAFLPAHFSNVLSIFLADIITYSPSQNYSSMFFMSCESFPNSQTFKKIDQQVFMENNTATCIEHPSL